MIARLARRRRAHRGMTLVEILIAMAIMGLMMMIAWSTIKSASNARVTFEAVEDRSHEIRLGMSRMVFDLEQAYLSKNEDQQRDNRLTMFVGKADEVRFSTFGHTTLWADANESDQTIVIYYLDDDRENSQHDSLYRKELRRPSNDNNWERQPGDVDVLIRNVEKLELEYWDWSEKDWQSDWDSTKADAENNKLPTRVRIKLTYEDARGDELTITTQARILLEEILLY